MGTTQAFRNALHIPVTDPTVGQVVTTAAPAGDLYPSLWQDGAAATGVPPGTAQYQMVISGPGPAFSWTTTDTIDCGTY